MAASRTEGKHRLKLKEKLGKGSFGDVVKGHLDGEIVAVKTLCKAGNGCDEGSSAEMFFREARMLQACSHRRIIGFKSLLQLPAPQTNSLQPCWALVMEYAKHGNLSQRIVQQMIQPGSKQYSNAQAIQWALDVASALEYLHMRTPAVLHRDVKSANIMLTSEDSCLVAKLSDFGLHVVVDNDKYQALHASSLGPISTAGKPGSNTAGQTAVRVTAPSSSSSASKTPDSSGHTAASSGATAAAQQQLAGVREEQLPEQWKARTATAIPAQEHQVYSEVHDSCGSRVYVDTHDSAKASTQQAGPGEARQQQPPKRRSSFRRAAHHPAGEALPRVSGVGEASAAADMQAAADANASLFAQWRSDSSSMGGSMCSLVSAGTWTTGGTGISGTDTAGSDCTEDTCGSIYEELETVFNMTGRTGSCLYMAPEVFLNHSYNEKSDVFSFGVVLYELMARTMVVFTELPTNSTDPTVAPRYAQKVADGYRPSRPKSMPDTMWALITACWHRDPLLRPHMTEVVAVLTTALEAALASQLLVRKSRPSFSFTRSAAADQGYKPKAVSPLTAATPADGAMPQATAADTPNGTSPRCKDQPGPAPDQQHPVNNTGDQQHLAPASQGCSCVIC